MLEAVGDDRSLGRAWLAAGFVHGGVRCRHADWAEAAERALVHYAHAGWPTSACVGELAAALYYGPMTVPEASARLEALLADSTIGRAGEANVLSFIGGLEAQRGRFQEARDLVAAASRIHEELGQQTSAATYSSAVVGDIELLAGRPDVAEHALRKLCELLEQQQNSTVLSSRAADLAETLYLQCRYDEAEHWTRISDANSAKDDLSANLSWRAVRAKIAAQVGDMQDAESLAREAVVLAGLTDGINWQAKTCLDLAEVLRLSGRDEEASARTEEAHRLYEQKGNVVGARQAAALLMVP